MSTIGAKVQWMPTARASRAATAWPRSMVSGSQDAAIAIGTGKMVRKPWMTSKPNSAGMPCRLPSTREPLQPVDLGGVGDEQQRADLAARQGAPRPGRLLGDSGSVRSAVGLGGRKPK